MGYWAACNARDAPGGLLGLGLEQSGEAIGSAWPQEGQMPGWTLMQYVVTVALDHTATADESDALVNTFLAGHAEASPVVGEDLRAGTIDVTFAVDAGDGYKAFSDTRAGAEQLIREAVPFHIDGLREAGESIPKPSAVAGEPFRVTAG